MDENKTILLDHLFRGSVGFETEGRRSRTEEEGQVNGRNHF